MKSQAVGVLLVSLLLTGCGLEPLTGKQAIEKWGGKVRFQLGRKWVDLNNTQVTDADLMHLKGMKNVEILTLMSTQVTDAGLEHLKGFTRLYCLSLAGTQVTDAGLRHLKGLENL